MSISPIFRICIAFFKKSPLCKLPFLRSPKISGFAGSSRRSKYFKLNYAATLYSLSSLLKAKTHSLHRSQSKTNNFLCLERFRLFFILHIKKF